MLSDQGSYGQRLFQVCLELPSRMSPWHAHPRDLASCFGDIAV